ncbi:PH domain-containing protein [Botrimarina hoheduenensis]|uniref:Bacterial membrane flanked domain protein n=1 Tax=Botrimarina hoheduenensis TaxID=2528000 RepID=A0A5C5VXG5_9BACT|nr:PH domain-containing protein [Botrimarina hoheduenensis]TWT42675.1 Bacterial membrane flanked domain protein [Botrimarina hoheduenensis]
MNEPTPPPRSTDRDPSADPDPSASGSAGDPKSRFTELARSRQGGSIEESSLWTGSYSPKAMIGAWFGGAIATLVTLVVALMMGLGGKGWGITLLLIALGWLLTAGFYWYRRLSVHYTLSDQRLVHESGLLWRTVDRVELIDVDDVTYRQGPIERALGVGTIVVSSSDRTSPELILPGIDRVREVADLIDDARRTERRSRGLHIESI